LDLICNKNYNECLILLYIASFLALPHFSKNKKGASVGRSFLFRKIAPLLQKAFHFHQGQNTHQLKKSVSLNIKINVLWQPL
jgi:hypothetical protein